MIKSVPSILLPKHPAEPFSLIFLPSFLLLHHTGKIHKSISVKTIIHTSSKAIFSGLKMKGMVLKFTFTVTHFMPNDTFSLLGVQL